MALARVPTAGGRVRRCVKTTRQRPEHAGRHRERLLAGVVVRHLSNRLAKYWGKPVRPALAHVVDAFGQVDLPDKAGEHGPVEEGLREDLSVFPCVFPVFECVAIAMVKYTGKKKQTEEMARRNAGTKPERRAAKALAEHRLENHPDELNLAGVPHGNLGEVLGRRPFFQREVRGMRPQVLLALRPAATTPRELVGRR